MEHEVSRAVIDSMQKEARLAQPGECCGILLGHGTRIDAIIPAANVHAAPETHFEIDPATLIAAHRNARSGGPRIAGYYHSHPVGDAVPSPTDSAMAAHDGSIWAIIAGDSVRLWHDVPGGFVPLPYAITAR